VVLEFGAAPDFNPHGHGIFRRSLHKRRHSTLVTHLLFALLGHTTTQAEDKVEGRLLLDVVVRKGAAVLELLAGEDKALLVRGDTLLVLDLGLDVVDGVRRLNLEGDGLAREGLDLYGVLGICRCGAMCPPRRPRCAVQLRRSSWWRRYVRKSACRWRC
jgi:hypothetical protein